MVTFIIPLNPVTKKNSQRIIYVKGRPLIVQSKTYLKYERDCGYFVKNINIEKRPINIQANYYRATHHKVDLTNLHAALHDILVKYHVISDDNANIVVSTNGSGVYYDKNNPRTEVIITYL